MHLENMINMDYTDRFNYIEKLIIKELSIILRLPGNKINTKRPIMEQGVDSLMTVELRNRLSTLFGIPLTTALLFNYPTIEKMSEYFLKNAIKFEDNYETEELKEFEELLNTINDSN